MGSTMGDLTRILCNSGRHEELPLVWSAYEVAEHAHHGQRRTNGDRYISHPVEVATIVADHGGTAPAVCAALLHDVVEDAGLSSARLHAEFGAEIAMMVDSVTSRAIRHDDAASRGLELLTVADRLHNLRTLRRVSAKGRRSAALDTLVFHVPLAHRLNAPALAAEMTDLACAALAAPDRRGASECLSRMTGPARRIDPRSAAQAAAALGGGAAVIGSDAIPEWALATGGFGLLVLVTAALFGRDPRAARRLADLVAAWRRS